MSQRDREAAAAPTTSPTPAAPGRARDGDPGWRVTLYTMWVAQLCAIMGFAFVMPFMPFYVRELGVRDPGMVAIWAGLLMTGSGVTMSLVAPFWGWLADRYGRKLMVQRAMFGGAAILSAMAFVRSAPQLLALRIFQGAVTGTVPASVALVSSVVPSSSLGYSLGLMQMSVFIGHSLGPYLGGSVADHFGYRKPFLVTGALLLTGGLLVLFGAKERFTRPEREEHAPGSSFRSILRVPGVVALLAAYTMMNLSGSFVAPIFPLFVEDILGQPGRAASETGLIIAATGITAAIAAGLVGRLSDRIGHRTMLVTCMVVAGLMSFPQAGARSVNQLLAMRVIFGLGAGGMIPAMNAIIATLVPRRSLGQAYGITTMASALGWATGPMLGGWAASALGFRPPFIIMGALLLASALAAHRGIRTSR